jgi:hypothetical protein
LAQTHAFYSKRSADWLKRMLFIPNAVQIASTVCFSAQTQQGLTQTHAFHSKRSADSFEILIFY